MHPTSEYFKANQHQDLFKGQGTVQVWDLFKSRDFSEFKAALWCELEAGGSVGRHQQEHYSELILCLSGEGHAHIDDETYGLKAGISVYLKQGQILQLKASSSTKLSYLIIKVKPEQP